jgi:opacity protein-like surface antigen
MKKLEALGKFVANGIAGIAVALALTGRTAGAQKLPTATAPGAYLAVGGTYGEFQAQYPQRLLGGAGVYVDLNLRRNFGVEGEVRWLRQNEIAPSNETTYLVGPRFELHRGRYKPYAKFLIGGGHLVFPDFNGYATGYGNYTVLAFGGGLDINLTEKIKLRAFDFEYQDWPYFYIPELTQQAITPYGISAGLSYRVLHTGGWRKHRYK